MKGKLYGLSAILVLFAWFFQIDVSAQKNQQLLLRKKETINSPIMAKEVLDEINKARQNPQRFIGYLEEYRGRFFGSRVKESNGTVMTTFEGLAAVDEAISFLGKLAPVESLQMTEGLVKSADLQLRDLSIDPSLGHTGADGSSFNERIRRFGTARGKLGENIAYRRSNARDIVLMWIIDDGVPSRIHRENLFNSEYKKAGIAYGKGNDDRGLCVLVLAAEFFEPEKPETIRMF